jgi:hypothetical protein
MLGLQKIVNPSCKPSLRAPVSESTTTGGSAPDLQPHSTGQSLWGYSAAIKGVTHLGDLSNGMISDVFLRSVKLFEKLLWIMENNVYSAINQLQSTQ